MAVRVPSQRYYAARLVIPAMLEEDVVAAFWEAGCLGVTVTPAAPRGRPARLTLREPRP